MGRKKVKQFSASGSKTTCIPLKNPEGVRGKRRQEVQKGSHEQEAVVRSRGRRRYKMGRRGIRDLKTGVGRECSISQGVPILQLIYTCQRSPGRK